MIILGAQTKEYIMTKILEVSKHGTTMTKLMHNLPLTHRRLRRIVAELVNRRFLKFLVSQEVYITTHRGHIFLDKLKKEISYSQDSNKATTIKVLEQPTLSLQ
jgi:predicted transcriptional regulator